MMVFLGRIRKIHKRWRLVRLALLICKQVFIRLLLRFQLSQHRHRYIRSIHLLGVLRLLLRWKWVRITQLSIPFMVRHYGVIAPLSLLQVTGLLLVHIAEGVNLVVIWIDVWILVWLQHHVLFLLQVEHSCRWVFVSLHETISLLLISHVHLSLLSSGLGMSFFDFHDLVVLWSVHRVLLVY